MKFSQEKALEIIAANGLKPGTIRAWRMRGAIPDIYAETEERVSLQEVIIKDAIDKALEKYGDELLRLLESRRFKPGQSDGYYRLALVSLCRECKTYEQTGKLS